MRIFLSSAFALTLGLTWVVQAAHAASVSGLIKLRTPIYKSPDSNSESLGEYPVGAKVSFEPASPPTWSKIFFPAKFKGVDIGYVQTSNISQMNVTSTPKRTEPLTSWVSIGLDGSLTSPAIAGTTPTAESVTVALMQYGITYNHALFKRVYLYSCLDYDSFSYTNFYSKKSLSGTGYTILAGAQFAVIRNDFLDVLAGAGLGSYFYSTVSAQNGTETPTTSLSGITYEIPRVTVLIPMSPRLSLDFNVGYQTKSLTGVNLVTGGTTTVDLSGPYGGFHLAWSF